MEPRRSHTESADLRVDAEVGNLLIEVKSGLTATSSLRASLIRLAYATTTRPRHRGILLLIDTAITRERLIREWELASSIFRSGVIERLGLCVGDSAPFTGIPSNPDPETERVLEHVIAEMHRPARLRRTRGDAHFVLLKVLLHHWLTSDEAITMQWLMHRSGYTYPTVASIVAKLGSIIERKKDRRLRVRWFPREELLRLIALSDVGRATARFVDRSGQPRSPVAHLRRLEQLAPKGVGVGGVLGARHYFPALDIAGTPRLDLSLHDRSRHEDLGFIRSLDPALERVEDPLAPATVVVHSVRHADSLFESRDGGLAWADPVECLLDLHEAHLELQAAQFFEALQRKRPSAI